ncbi:hypothetical protein C8J56DRAFT_1061168 [Mycena floridula]|nr:hypothetical protein C8J56DRAFT_1061168 [Mycena floridula]
MPVILNPYSTRAWVPGTNEARRSVRPKVWGATTLLGPPSMWQTWNVADTQNPLAQFLCGHDIDLDEFDHRTSQPAGKRAIAIVEDPFAAAEFFHTMIQAMFECLIVEAQGRGSLHLHVLLWMSNAPTSKLMEDALKHPFFRENVGDLSDRQLISRPKLQDAGNCRPLRPDIPNYHALLAEREIDMVRAFQVHTCNSLTCLRMLRGKKVCKHGAPFAVSKTEWVSETGNWGPKRLCDHVNSFCPPIMAAINANHDFKIIMTAYDTKGIGHYMSNYAFKNQGDSNHLRAEDTTVAAINRCLILRCSNTLNKCQNMSAPEVVSLIMGWGVTLASHHYVKIYLDPIDNALCKASPGLGGNRPNQALNAERGHETDVNNSEPAETFIITEGTISFHDQLKKYTDRGHGLETMTLLDYFLNTYHSAKKCRHQSNQDTDEEMDKEQPEDSGVCDDDAILDEEEPLDDEDLLPDIDEELIGSPEPNLPKASKEHSQRVPYLQSANRSGVRIIRGQGHETLPQFVGRWFPKRTEPAEKERYCATMLLFLSPWRKFEDLKADRETFEATFNGTNFTKEALNIMENIQYFHDASSTARRNREKKEGAITQAEDMQGNGEEGDFDVVLEGRHLPITEADIELARKSAGNAHEKLFAQRTLETARFYNIFPSETSEFNDGPAFAQNATAVNMGTIRWLAKTLKNVVRRGALSLPVLPVADPGVSKGKGKEPEHYQPDYSPAVMPVSPRFGGTGKTVTINTISEMFRQNSIEEWLAITATSGVAATLIEGVTVHFWGGIPVNDKRKKQPDPDIDKFIKETLQKEGLDDGGPSGESALPFGGFNVIMCGDQHQFPPVANPLGALYCDLPNDTEEGTHGRALYKQFTTVVSLTKQHRVDDPVWNDMLLRLRVGECTEEDVEMVKGQMLEQMPTDFTVPPWNDIAFLTARNESRKQWNEASAD